MFVGYYRVVIGGCEVFFEVFDDFGEFVGGFFGEFLVVLDFS